jgi:hypothetical protein
VATGSFLVHYAQRRPARNFIGVERLLGRIRKVDRKGRRAGLTNLRGGADRVWRIPRIPPAAAIRGRLASLFSSTRGRNESIGSIGWSTNDSLIALAGAQPGGVIYFADRRRGIFSANGHGVRSECGLSTRGNAGRPQRVCVTLT